MIEEKSSVGDIYYNAKNLQFRSGRMVKQMCPGCNSGCNTNIALKKDATRFLRYLVAGK